MKRLCLVFIVLIATTQLYAVSLVASWNFEETSGNLIDESGNGLSGTLNGTYTRGVEGAYEGSKGYYFDYSGYAYIGDPTGKLAFSSSFSIAFWVKAGLQTGSADSIYGLFNRQHDSSHGWTSQEWRDQDDIALLVGMGTGSPGITYIEISDVLDSQWHHITFTVDTSNNNVEVKSYLDGVQYSSSFYSNRTLAPSATSAPLTIGKGLGSRQFQGYLDDFEIYSGVLATGDITELSHTVPEPTPFLLLFLFLGSYIFFYKK